jgi:hypothetical protein
MYNINKYPKFRCLPHEKYFPPEYPICCRDKDYKMVCCETDLCNTVVLRGERSSSANKKKKQVYCVVINILYALPIHYSLSQGSPNIKQM